MYNFSVFSACTFCVNWGWQVYTAPEHVLWLFFHCYNFILTSMFLSERPLLLYDIICGSLKFGLAMLVAVLRISVKDSVISVKILNFEFGVMLCNEGIFALFLWRRARVLHSNFTPVGAFWILLCCLQIFEGFVLTSPSVSPLTKPFFTHGVWHVVKDVY